MVEQSERQYVVATIMRKDHTVKTIIPAPSIGSMKRYLRFRMPQLRRAGTASKVRLAVMPASQYRIYRATYNV